MSVATNDSLWDRVLRAAFFSLDLSLTKLLSGPNMSEEYKSIGLSLLSVYLSLKVTNEVLQHFNSVVADTQQELLVLEANSERPMKRMEDIAE